ncbi:MAG TPA: hypothetical protein DCM60_02960 [Nitrospina sp.]|nr:hypothetical protein [Nitrospina sp.]
MSMRISRYLCVTGCALIFVVSCQSKRVPISSEVKPEMPSLPALFSQLEARQSAIHDVKAFVRTKISGERLNQSFRQALLVRGNEAIRVDTYSLFRQVLGVLIYEDGKTLMYDPGANRVVYGQEVWDIMRRVLGTHLNFTEYISVFSGGIPRFFHLQVKDAQWDTDQTVYRIETIDRETKEQVDIEIDAYTLLPKSVTRFRGSQEMYKVCWDDYQKVGQLNFAHKILIELKDRDETVLVKYSDPVINQGLAPDAFQLASELVN